MIFITEIRPPKSFSEKSGEIWSKILRKTGPQLRFPAKWQAISTENRYFREFR